MILWNPEKYYLIQSKYQLVYGKELVNSLNSIFPLAGRKVADLGCGEGTLTNFISGIVGNEGKVVGVDIDEGMVIRARKEYDGITFINSDVTEWLKKAEEKYDFIISNAMLHWLKTYDRLNDYFKYSYDILNDGGYGCCRFSLSDHALKSKEFLQKHLRKYLQNDSIVLSKPEFSFDKSAEIIEKYFDIVLMQELVYKPFKESDILNFEWLVKSQPLAQYFCNSQYEEFVIYLYNEWKKEMVEVYGHQCIFVYRKKGCNREPVAP